MRSLKIVLLSTVVLFAGHAAASTICSSGSSCGIGVESGTLSLGSVGNDPLSIGDPLSLMNSVYVDGDLYIDYSLFSDSEDLNITRDVQIYANTLTIFSYSDAATLPDSIYGTLVNSGDSLSFTDSGSWVLFGSTPISNGRFEATGNLYIGNYSSIAPVPVPASIILFISGLSVSAWIGNRKKRFRKA